MEASTSNDHTSDSGRSSSASLNRTSVSSQTDKIQRNWYFSRNPPAAGDLVLAIIEGLGFTLFNCLIGEYLNTSVAFDAEKASSRSSLLQAVINLLAVGLSVPILSILHHKNVPSNFTTNGDDLNSKKYRIRLGILIRDVIHFVSTILVGLYLCWKLTIPTFTTSIAIVGWTALLKERKCDLLKSLVNSAPSFFFFINMAIFGLYAYWLVDLNELKYPGYAFSIVLSIGTSSFQLAKTFSQCKTDRKIHLENRAVIHTEDKVGKASIFTITPSVVSTVSRNLKKSQERSSSKTFWSSNIFCYFMIKWPFLCFIGILMIICNAFGPPVFTRLTGMYFSVYEQSFSKSLSKTSMYISLSQGEMVCAGYVAMGVVVLISMTAWNTAFSELGKSLQSSIEKSSKIAHFFKNFSTLKIKSFPLQCGECFYGIVCLTLSCVSAFFNNQWMGTLAICMFIVQVIIQATLLLLSSSNRSKIKEAFEFASTNGLQQTSQALCYLGGYILVEQGLVSPLDVFKIIQTMHVGSAGMVSSFLVIKDIIGTKCATTFSSTKKQQNTEESHENLAFAA